MMEAKLTVDLVLCIAIVVLGWVAAAHILAADVKVSPDDATLEDEP